MLLVDVEPEKSITIAKLFEITLMILPNGKFRLGVKDIGQLKLKDLGRDRDDYSKKGSEP